MNNTLEKKPAAAQHKCEYDENTITEVCMHQNNILGTVNHIGRYDLISVILVGLSKKISENIEEHTLNRLLEILFSKLTPEQKKHIDH